VPARRGGQRIYGWETLVHMIEEPEPPVRYDRRYERPHITREEAAMEATSAQSMHDQLFYPLRAAA
jgi:hypothetical protein